MAAIDGGETDQTHGSAERPGEALVDELAPFRGATAVMRTVYEVAMVLGLKQVFDEAYTVFSPITRAPSQVVPLEIDIALFIAVLLIAIRFFWITRNITSYLRRNREAMADRRRRVTVARSVILIHFPVIILHALIFFFLSRSCADAMGIIHSDSHSVMRAYDFAAQFVVSVGVLLLLNGAWLLLISDTNPGRFWAWNNLITAAVIAILGLLRVLLISPRLFTQLSCAVIVINSLWDLWGAASFYILVDDEATVSESGFSALRRPRPGTA